MSDAMHEPAGGTEPAGPGDDLTATSTLAIVLGQPGSTLRALVALAAFCGVVAAAKVASAMLLPIVFSVFLALLAWPMVRSLERLKVPRAAGIPLVVVGIAVGLLVIVAILGTSLASFTASLPAYERQLAQQLEPLQGLLARIGVEQSDFNVRESIDPGAILSFAGSTLSGLASGLSNVFVVALTLVFLLMEAAELSEKMKLAVHDPESLQELFGFGDTIQRYVVIKTLISLGTGGAVWLGMALIGLDFPLLWGLVAFLLNYIPNVGSVLAAAPPILLAIVQLGWGWAVVVLCIFVAVNMVLGNFLEPRLLGESLGLSAAVVFLSLIFWGWVWGPLGMLLSVPLTVIAQVLASMRPDTRWLALMLSSKKAGERLMERVGS